MKKSTHLNKLPPEVVNQIAAGEVIERPASVVKELVDNCIDAGSTKISIKVRDGGMSLIEISDNGIGIPKENLADIFLAHTTTKLKDIDDLNNLLSMGFRGEALSTVVAVAKVNMVSKYDNEDIANEITFKDQSDFKIKSAAREKGTVIRVENIFDSIPVRKKYLKTAQTEYRNILNTLTPYFLIYPNISWELEKDGKQVLDLDVKSDIPGKLNKERTKEVLKQDFVDRMETVFFEGNGMKISGLTAHPSDHMKRTKYQYIFVNGRNVWDNGIARGVVSGYERYIPHGEKVPFLINIVINPDQVDVNVHPRKEEVKFLNPYRVYSAVQQAVNKSIEKLVSYKNIPEQHGNDFSQPVYTPDFSNRGNTASSNVQDYTQSRDINFSKGSGSVQDSLKFSEAILQNFSSQSNGSNGHGDINTQRDMFSPSNTEVVEEGNSKDYKKEKVFSMHQIFNKYIIVEFEREIWVIDQHAAAERITFEKLSKQIEIANTDIQNLLVPTPVVLDIEDIEFIKENRNTIENIGLNIDITDNTLNISSVPVEFVSADLEKLIKDILNMDIEDGKKDLDRLKLDMVATMACHTSIRTGQKLDVSLMRDVYYNLLECDNPYSCPHGRPIVWKMSIEQIDHNFDRTY